MFLSAHHQQMRAPASPQDDTSITYDFQPPSYAPSRAGSYSANSSTNVAPNAHPLSGSVSLNGAGSSSGYGSSSGSSNHRSNRASHSGSEMSSMSYQSHLSARSGSPGGAASMRSIESGVVAPSVYPGPNRHNSTRHPLPPIPPPGFPNGPPIPPPGFHNGHPPPLAVPPVHNHPPHIPSQIPTSPVSSYSGPRPTPSVASRSRESHTFKFEPTGFNTMKLIPAFNYEDQSIPRYHVSVAMNCFNPSSFITTITRGETGYGDFVAEFEMGISTDKATLSFHEQFFELEDVFSNFRKVGSKLGDRYDWKRAYIELHWDPTTSEPGTVCYRKGDHDKKWMARIIPSQLQQRTAGNPRPRTTLEVKGGGMDILDDLVVSALLVERRRLSPKEKAPLFN